MKYEAQSTKSEKGSKSYDLEERAFVFAKTVRRFTAEIEQSVQNREDIKQLVRSSGSVGANYIEANEGLSTKDAVMRVKIAKKEAKESRWWLELLKVRDAQEAERLSLVREATELMNILAAIQRKMEERLK